MNYYVTDSPPVIINIDEMCTTSVIISLNTHSHPACGEVSHNVTISGNVIYWHRMPVDHQCTTLYK